MIADVDKEEIPQGKVPVKWRDTYLPNWKGRKTLLHKRDLRSAGFPDEFISMLNSSGSRLPGGKRVSKSVIDARDVYQLRERISRKMRKERNKSLRESAAAGNIG